MDGFKGQFDTFQISEHNKIIIFSNNPENEKDGAVIADMPSETNSAEIIAKVIFA
jgi:hypothetical protein